MYKIIYEEFKPKANEKNIIIGSNYRITILTSKLIRLEYSKQNLFEDRQTKLVLNRDFGNVKYNLYENEKELKIETEDLIIKYDKKEFSPYGLSVELRKSGGHPYKGIWHYGDQLDNLGGTLRTLDFIDGTTQVEPGILSKYGISVLDDSNSPILTKDGWFESRDTNDIDLYIFGFNRNYLEALDIFYQLTGPQPKLPRYSLGNWWSRYHSYTEDSYLKLINRFEAEKIPFTVAVIDMDWHLTNIPESFGTGWTGFTWDKELFPDPARFLKALKLKGLSTTLNIHPAGGIRVFESMYEDMAEHLNVENIGENKIEFNPYSEEFLSAAFQYIFHPNEKMGVDFWWIDWQQGPQRIDYNRDPLWILNHYHFSDNQKNNNLGITFSRYSGPGSHRYPIGFSGDTVISWESLDFQPYFTSTASNIGYGWWSHDIGGHRNGTHSDELMLRWVQLGVFSPINRIHSSNSEFLVKEPWNYRKPFSSLIKRYLQLRHRLIPYLYTMNINAHEENIPLIRPMYYYYPYEEASYEVANQYYFGDSLIICPITKKINGKSLQAHFRSWLPKGNWYDLQSGLKYSGNRFIDIYRPIERLGVFLKEGSILPLANLSSKVNSIENPRSLEIILGYGESGQFVLREDFLNKEKIEEGSDTKIEYNQNTKTIFINSPQGNLNALPKKRVWKLKIYGAEIRTGLLKIGSEKKYLYSYYDEEKNISSFQLPEIFSSQSIEFIFEDIYDGDEKASKKKMIYSYLLNAQIPYEDKKKIYQICNTEKDDTIILSEVLSLPIELEILKPVVEIILA